MDIEILEAMNESMNLSLLMVIEVTMWITIFFAIASFIVYLAALAWLCFEEIRRPARGQMRQAAPRVVAQVGNLRHESYLRACGAGSQPAPQRVGSTGSYL
jgi:hypothetical protein